MTNGALFWLIMFALSAAVFLVVAAIVALKGLSDLRDLLGLGLEETANNQRQPIQRE